MIQSPRLCLRVDELINIHGARVAIVSVSEKLKQQKDRYIARGKYVWIATRTVKLKRLACSQENPESRP